jgi:hypothetical protein
MPNQTVILSGAVIRKGKILEKEHDPKDSKDRLRKRYPIRCQSEVRV